MGVRRSDYRSTGWLFLDSYIDRAEGAAGSGMRADDIEVCDWIVIGHSHFDHLYGAERIMANTNATLIGSYVAPLRDAIERGGSRLVELGYVDATEILGCGRP